MRLGDYLKKIGVAPPLEASIETLRRVHLAHRETFLFENLSIQRGGRISLTVDALERKFLDEGAGGYCFEHNTLFGAVLADLGFTFTSLLARVRRGPSDGWMRTHMVLRVVVAGEPWLADVGFGGFGLLEPLPLAEGATIDESGVTYALRRESGAWVLAMRDRSGTSDLYEFTDDPQTTGDIEVANHYTSTHPASMFRRTLTIQRSTRAERTILRSNVLVQLRDGEIVETPVDRRQLRATARNLFGVELPATALVFESDEPDGH
jgi:N-hydroxyarylamine O-acetyltransferase